MMKFRWLLLIIGTLYLAPGYSQKKKQKQDAKAETIAVKADTTKKSPEPKTDTNGPKPYDKVITTDAVTSPGFITVHRIKDEYFFELPDSVLDRDLLVVSRIAKAAAGSRSGFFGYAGDQIGSRVIQFTKGPEDKLFLKTISYSEIATDSSENGMYHSLRNSNMQPIVESFDIAAFSKDSNGVIVDFTKYLKGDNDILFFSENIRKRINLSSAISDRSYINGVKSFPTNVEIITTKTYTKRPAAGGSTTDRTISQGSSVPVTYELNSSIVMLPKVPMKPRYYDSRVGYFAASTTDFDANPQGIKKLSMAVRWNLKPREEDMEKYKRGELVEPEKQIVYYIDPATPKKWVPYLIQGVNDWQSAFEQAGFKNAIVAKEAPTGDTTWSLDDARNSAIVYKPSVIANAMGPNVHDPRSGEIIESHISWYHNVMELLRNWYFIQASPNDTAARKMEFSDELMGQLIRFVSSHEVGHTLGLRHNFGASSTVPVEKLRDRNWLNVHGHTPSIMDYARFNYVAQPEDHIPRQGLLPRIGEYDKWAIQWGYQWLPQFGKAEDEKAYLNRMIIDSLTANPRLFFGTESDANDPRNQNEDLGDDAVLASAYGIKNLKRIMPNLLKWTEEPDEGYKNATDIYKQLIAQFGRYMGHVAKNIGGIEWTPSTVEQSKPVYVFTSKARQKRAMQFLQAELFQTPEWLLDEHLFKLIGLDQANSITSIQKSILVRILNTRTLNNLVRNSMISPGQAYSVADMLKDLKGGIWSELKTGKTIDIYRRNLQKAYVENLVRLLRPASYSQSSSAVSFQSGSVASIVDNDAFSNVRGQAVALRDEILKAIPRTRDTQSKLHLQDVAERLKNGLDPLVK